MGIVRSKRERDRRGLLHALPSTKCSHRTFSLQCRRKLGSEEHEVTKSHKRRQRQLSMSWGSINWSGRSIGPFAGWLRVMPCRQCQAMVLSDFIRKCVWISDFTSFCEGQADIGLCQKMSNDGHYHTYYLWRTAKSNSRSQSELNHDLCGLCKGYLYGWFFKRYRLNSYQ